VLSLPLELKVKAVKIGNSIRMTLPKDIVDYLGIRQGDTLLVSVTDHQVNVRKKEKP
jgi:AbrB family looped-hinge helix DNA binding protein